MGWFRNGNGAINLFNGDGNLFTINALTKLARKSRDGQS